MFQLITTSAVQVGAGDEKGKNGGEVVGNFGQDKIYRNFFFELFEVRAIRFFFRENSKAPRNEIFLKTMEDCTSMYNISSPVRIIFSGGLKGIG